MSSAKRLSKTAWIVAFLISPAAPFVCLRMERAISTLQCVLGALAALLVHVGLVSVLIHTNGQPLQFFIVMLLSVSLYLVFFWQYVAGHSISLWSEDAERQWRLAARFFGVFLAVGIAVAILGFHLDRTKSPRPNQARLASLRALSFLPMIPLNSNPSSCVPRAAPPGGCQRLSRSPNFNAPRHVIRLGIHWSAS